MSRPAQRFARSAAATRRDRTVTALAALLLTAGTLAALLVGPGAEAQTGRTVVAPATAETVAYPLGATATYFRGKAFDTCTAPSRKAMTAWRSSPYRAVGIYISGRNRACKQPQLTAAWVADVTAMGWKLLPVNMGLQSPCRDNKAKQPMRSSRAAAQGTAEAAAAVSAAQALGILQGSPIYADIEPYDPDNASCARAVGTYLDAWTRELHRRGYLSGMYGNLGAALPDAVARYASAAHVRPDAIWMARWDRKTAMKGWALIPDSHWSVRQRVKQYRGDHLEKHGGVRMNIDSDQVDAPVATVARTYLVTSAAPLNVRRGPSTAAEILDTREPGATLAVLCQVTGVGPAGAMVWDKLTDGSYVADAYVGAGAAKPVPPCSYPLQALPGDGTVTRTAVGATAPASTTLPLGALAAVSCRASEQWLRLTNGRYVAAADLAPTTSPLPAC